MEKITGKNNDLVKNIKKLLTSSKERKTQGLFVLEGARLVFDVLNSLYSVKYFLVTDKIYDKYNHECTLMLQRAQASFLISDDIAQKLGDTQNSQGVFAVCFIGDDDGSQPQSLKNQIALDNIQDPSNLGAIVRTAEALGIGRVVVGSGCDIYNPKALRASMGSMLRMNVLRCENLAQYLTDQKQQGYNIYATTPNSSARFISDVDFTQKSICVIGNEANGVSQEVINSCTDLVTIKMSGRAESLNASVAAAITMWEMVR